MVLLSYNGKLLVLDMFDLCLLIDTAAFLSWLFSSFNNASFTFLFISLLETLCVFSLGNYGNATLSELMIILLNPILPTLNRSKFCRYSFLSYLPEMETFLLGGLKFFGIDLFLQTSRTDLLKLINGCSSKLNLTF